MPHRKLKDIIADQKLVHASIDDTVAETVKRMQQHHVGAALILDNGELKGIFTGSNLFHGVLKDGLDPNTVCIADVMTGDPVCLDCNALGFEAVRHMRDHGIRHIVVLNTGENGYGVVSIRDFPNEKLGEYDEEFEFENKLWEQL